MTTQANILVVDDTPDNLRLLSAMLTKQGYRVRKALNGQMALVTAQKIPPDLILMDVNMPGKNGYEVCQALKKDERTQEIPVIFISALDDVLDKVKAFQVGGVDYISKPFQEQEVLARIEHQLTIRRQQRQLREQNEQLQQEINDRQKAEDALRVYLHAVSHDLRNPVLGMTMVLNNLLHQQVPEAALVTVPASILERMQKSCDRQLALINSLVETQQYEVWGVSLSCQPLHLYSLTRELAAEWEPMLVKSEITLKNLITDDLPKVKADFYQLWRVYENLIANALKHNPPGIQLALSAEVLEVEAASPMPLIRCVVADDGVGMDSEQSNELFELYQRGNSSRRTIGLGLGLYLCRQIIAAHGGEIGVITRPGAGAQFWFTLPVSPE